MSSKMFLLHWKDGSTEYAKGDSITDAFRTNGYGSGALSALDYYEEATELPRDKKEIMHLGELGVATVQNRHIISIVREAIAQNKKTMNIMNNLWEITDETPLAFFIARASA